MRRLVVVGSLLLCACADNFEPLEVMQSRVQFFQSGSYERPSFDLLFVIDSSPAMGPYQGVRALYPALADLFGYLAIGMPDVHVGVVTADLGDAGVMRRSPVVTGAFLSDVRNIDGTRTTNYTGSLASAVASLADVGVSGSAPSPLAATLLALDDNIENSGFLRDRAYLFVLIISAQDDASTATPAEYASFLRAVKVDSSNVVVSGVYLRPAPRLEAFLAEFPNRSTTTTLDSPDPSVASALELISGLCSYVGGEACLVDEPVDVDPVTAGKQYDCVIATVTDDGDESQLAACETITDGSRCWRIVSDPTCGDAGSVRVDVRSFLWPDRPHLRGDCLMN